jgi:predicted nucleic acid-binding protein
MLSQDVLGEIDDVLRVKLPHARANLAILLDNSNVSVSSPPGISTVQKCQSFVHYANDAVVLAGAVDAEADYFVTLDRQHFLGNQSLHAAMPFPLGTPGDFLAWYRHRLSTSVSPPN